MDICEINGKTYDVLIIELLESFEILYSENTGRSTGVGSPMVLDPLGSFFSHKVTFKRKKENTEDYDSLFDLFSTPRYDGVNVRIVHNQDVLEYRAYVSKGERKLKRVDEQTGKVYWDEMQISFVPMEAQILP